MDVVYMVRDDGAVPNDELRYSLRSLVSLQHDRVWIVGHRPGWVSDNVTLVPTRQGQIKHENTWSAWWAMATTSEISSQFVLMNDDFFVMRPMVEVPTLHAGSLDAWTESLGRGVGTRNRMRHTIHAIRTTLTHQQPMLSYELHVPMVLDRTELTRAMVVGSAYRNAHLSPPLCKRSLYGNLANAGGTLGIDPKVRNNLDVPSSNVPVVSTSDAAFHYGRAGQWLRERFSEPGPYEIPRPVMPRSRGKGVIVPRRSA